MKLSVIISAFCFLLIVQNIYCQGGMQEKWMVTTSVGIEKHDKRLFDYSEKDMLLEMQPEKWGTYHFNIGIKRRAWKNIRFSSFVGVGIGYENATFLRPFDHRHFETGIALDILRNLNRYKKIQTPLNLSLIYEIGYHWFLSGDLTSNFLVHRSIDHTENDTGYFPYTESTFEMDDLHFDIGINYRIGPLLIGLNSRILNFQKIDKIIFNHYLKDPRIDQKWEWHNPLRFDLTIGYMW